MTVWIVMYQVGWDGLENIEGVFSSELLAEDFVSGQKCKNRYVINEHDVD